jgi:glutathione S-transferase
MEELIPVSLTLYIGNKAYSSWSLRAWLALSASGAKFEEVRIALYQPGSSAELSRHSPTGRVPVLRDRELVIWDSLAICEYVAERFPAAGLWPAEVSDRARARSVSAEMHSGFAALRNALPMNVRATGRKVKIDAAVEQDIARVCTIWRECRTLYADCGPWLLGAFSIADCMYAPVVMRFHTYGVACGVQERAYVATMLGHPALKSWISAAAAETEIVEANEAGR